MIGPPSLTGLASGLTAMVGLYVAWLATRGYRKHGSATMGALALGIVAITVVPFLIAHVIGPAVAFSDAQSILGVMVSHTVGLLAIYQTFR